MKSGATTKTDVDNALEDEEVTMTTKTAPKPDPKNGEKEEKESNRLAAPRWRRVTQDRSDADRQRRRRLFLIGLPLVLVALVVADIMLMREVDDRDAKTTAGKTAVAEARVLVPRVLSYKADTLDADLTRGLAATTGSFHDDLGNLQASLIGPAAKQQKIVTKAVVTGAGVVSAEQDEVRLIVFVTQSTSASGRAAQIDGSRLEVTMTRAGSDWLISELAPV